MSCLGNLLWLILGGFILAAAWLLAGFFCCLTIVGIPLGLQCFKFAELTLAPFGREIVYQKNGAISLLANIIWLLIFGLPLAGLAAVLGLSLCLSIIGIPFGL